MPAYDDISNQLLREDIATDVPPAICRRILIGQAFYGLARSFASATCTTASPSSSSSSFPSSDPASGIDLPESSLQEP